MSAYRTQDRQWMDETSIIKDAFILERVFYLELNRLPTVSFNVEGIDEGHWGWLLKTLGSQVAFVAEQAYANGQRDAQTEMRKAVGLK